jgi:hypothetical protein
MDMTTNTTNVTVDNLKDFQNGTAGGLTCFGVMNMPALDEYPYGPGFDWAALVSNSSSTSNTSSSGTTSTKSAPSATSAGANAAKKVSLAPLMVLPFTLALAIGAAGIA